MKKEDLVRIIQAVEAVEKIDEACHIMTGMGLDQGEATEVLLLWEILRDYAKDEYRKNDDLDKDVDNYTAFDAVFRNQELSAEEKYNLLFEE